MTTTATPGWDTCVEPDCGGARLASGGRCLAHAGEQDTVVELNRIGDGGALDLRGVAVSSELLQRLLATVPRGDDDRPLLTAARFDEATFKGETKFDRVIFQSPTTFSGATFQGVVSFLRVNFTAEASFARAEFAEDVSFFMRQPLATTPFSTVQSLAVLLVLLGRRSKPKLSSALRLSSMCPDHSMVSHI